MSGTKGFKLIADEEVAAAPPPDETAQSRALVMLALRSLSQRTMTAITNLFTVGLVLSAWLLWRSVLGDPTDRQLVALAGYGLFCLLIDIVRRRK